MNKKLLAVKLAHTFLWAFYVADLIYIFYAGIAGRIDPLLWVAVGLVILEGVILISFGWKCPFTVLGYRFTDTREIGFDIFLPKWLARYNKLIYSILFAVGILIIGCRMLLA